MNQTPGNARQKSEDEYPEYSSESRLPHSVSRTPRFRLGPLQPQSSVQFASTPRFLFRGDSHSHRPTAVEEINRDNQEDVQRLKRPSSSLHGEVIQDSDSESESIDNTGSILSGRGDEPGNQTVTSGDACGSDDEIIVPFSPTRPKTKRQKQLFKSPPIRADPNARRSIPGDDAIASSSLGSSPPAFAEDTRSPRSELNEEEIVTPVRKEPFHGQLSASHPRFIVNQRQIDTPTQLNYSQVHYHGEAVAPESTPRQKPRFVLPSTPEAALGEKKTGPVTSPSPFSPLVRRSKRGRASSLAKPDFISDGMATQVRNWILEIGVNRLATGQPSPLPASMLFSSTHPVSGNNDAGASQVYPHDNHCLITKVSVAKLSTKRFFRGAGHPAPFILCKHEVGDKSALFTTLLLNPPLKAPSSLISTFKTIQDGSSIGIRKALAWEIEIDSFPTDLDYARKDNIDTTEKPSQLCLVGTHWDIID